MPSTTPQRSLDRAHFVLTGHSRPCSGRMERLPTRHSARPVPIARVRRSTPPASWSDRPSTHRGIPARFAGAAARSSISTTRSRRTRAGLCDSARGDQRQRRDRRRGMDIADRRSARFPAHPGDRRTRRRRRSRADPRTASGTRPNVSIACTASDSRIGPRQSGGRELLVVDVGRRRNGNGERVHGHAHACATTPATAPSPGRSAATGSTVWRRRSQSPVRRRPPISSCRARSRRTLCADGGSGVATCNGTVSSGSAVDTTTVGLHAFTVSAGDAVGNISSATVRYTVVATNWPQFHNGAGSQRPAVARIDTEPDECRRPPSRVGIVDVVLDLRIAGRRRRRAYTPSSTGYLYAFSAAYGNQLWATPIGGTYLSSSPAVADGRVFIGSDDGNVYAIDAASGERAVDVSDERPGATRRPPSRVGSSTSAPGTPISTRSTRGRESLVWQQNVGLPGSRRRGGQQRHRVSRQRHAVCLRRRHRADRSVGDVPSGGGQGSARRPSRCSRIGLSSAPTTAAFGRSMRTRWR